LGHIGGRDELTASCVCPGVPCLVKVNFRFHFPRVGAHSDI
jgi:hypothetical protein